MWRSVAVTRRALSRRREAQKLVSIKISFQVLSHPGYNSPEISHSKFSSRRSLWDSKKISFYPSPRFFSHDSSSAYENAEELCAEPEGSHISEEGDLVDSHNMIDESPSWVSSEFTEEDVVLDVKNSSSSVGDGENLAVDSGVSEDDESVVEDGEIQEIDLEKLESVLSLLQSSGSAGVSLETSLENTGLDLNEEIVTRVLKTPFVPAENLVAFFKWVSKQQEYSVTTRCVEALAVALSSELRGKNAYTLWNLIQEIGEREKHVLNTEILNALISLFSRLGRGKVAYQVLDKFEEFGCIPNVETYYFTVEALSRRSLYDLASSVCMKMLDADHLPDAEKIGKLMSYLCKGRLAIDAHTLYTCAREKERRIPQYYVNVLISSLCREDDAVLLALKMLDDMSQEQRKSAIQPFSSVMRGLCRIKEFGSAKKLLLSMIEAGPPPGNAVFNMIIDGFCKAGDMDEAITMMEVIKKRGLKPDLYAYIVITSGYAKGGSMEEAYKIFTDAKKQHSKLCPVIYHTLIRGYCKLEQFEKALELLGEMEDYGVQPKADEYNKLITSLCLKALDWRTSEKLLEEMKEKGLHLNGNIRALIRAVKELEEERMETTEVTVEA